MRDRKRWLPLLFAGSLISSCTCSQQTEQVAKPAAPVDRHVGFDTGQNIQVGKAPNAPDMPATPNQFPPTPQAENPDQNQVAEIPADFPSDVQLMQDAEVAGVHEMAQNARSVLLRTDQELPGMYSFYEKDLKAKGWTLEQNYQAKDQAFLGFRRGNTILNMTIAKDPNNPTKRLVNVMYQEDHKPDFDEF